MVTSAGIALLTGTQTPASHVPPIFLLLFLLSCLLLLPLLLLLLLLLLLHLLLLLPPQSCVNTTNAMNTHAVFLIQICLTCYMEKKPIQCHEDQSDVTKPDDDPTFSDDIAALGSLLLVHRLHQLVDLGGGNMHVFIAQIVCSGSPGWGRGSSGSHSP